MNFTANPLEIRGLFGNFPKFKIKLNIMAKLHIESITISWGISRGRDTYGWNICRAVSRDTGKTYRTIGGGYDMVGTVIGEWFAAEHQKELQALTHANLDGFVKYGSSGSTLHNPAFYGLYIRANGSVFLDGGCGIESMLRIIKSCGFEYQRQYNPKTKSKATTGYLFSKEIIE